MKNSNYNFNMLGGICPKCQHDSVLYRFYDQHICPWCMEQEGKLLEEMVEKGK